MGMRIRSRRVATWTAAAFLIFVVAAWSYSLRHFLYQNIGGYCCVAIYSGRLVVGLSDKPFPGLPKPWHMDIDWGGLGFMFPSIDNSSHPSHGSLRIDIP